MIRLAVRGGIAKSMSTEVQSIVHVKNGTLRSVMPGARNAHDRRDKIDRRRYRADSADQQSQGPEIRGQASRVGVFGHWCVGEPAHEGSGARGVN